MMTAPSVTISAVSEQTLLANAPRLGAILHACVENGASIGFVQPFPVAAAEAFWLGGVAAALRAGTRTLLVAWQGDTPVGAVQLDYDTPANQPHRADVRKLLVHPACRRQGIARGLMIELEACARGVGRSLLTLDTRSGDRAESLYASLGYQTAGVIPGFAREPAGSRLDATTIMYKTL